MSHFTVLVFGDDIEDMLDPYWELDMRQEDMAEDPRAEFDSEAINTPSTGVFPEDTEDRPDCNPELKTVDELLEEFKMKHPEEAQKYDTVTDWIKRWHGWYYNPETDTWGRWWNPNGFWDWYSIGGRWSESLALKRGKGSSSKKRKYVNQARVGDVDWDFLNTATPEQIEHCKKEWLYAVEKCVSPEEYQNLSKEEQEDRRRFFIFYNKQHYLDHYGTLERFIEMKCRFTTFAVLDENGWHQPGRMGWFGMSSETPESANDWNDHFRERFIDGRDPDTIVTVVDCHI